MGKTADNIGKTAGNIGKAAGNVGMAASNVGKAAGNVFKAAGNAGFIKVCHSLKDFGKTIPLFPFGIFCRQGK